MATTKTTNNGNGKTWHEKHHEKLTLGQKFADNLARVIGSWKFIIGMTIFVIFWIILNVTAYLEHWDQFPFILLNVLLSMQAAYAAPIIMMSQNRQAERDRVQAMEDYKTDVGARVEIEELRVLIKKIEAEKLDKIAEKLEEISKLVSK